MPHAAKLILSAVVISLINKTGIAVGFLAWHHSGAPNQLMVQVPLAVTVSIAGTMLWWLKFRRWHRLELERDGIYVFLLVFPVGTALWIPIHYLWTGYLTGMGNIVGGWIFAFLANAPAFALTASLWRRHVRREA